MLRKGIILAMLLALAAPTKAECAELTETEKGMLMMIAQAEAEGEGTEGKAAVMRVVLNRVEDERFPGTVAEVILQKGQFSTAKEGGRLWNAEADAECFEAVTLVENGWDEAQGALYFNSCGKKAGQYLFTLGNHNFYR